MTFLVIGKGEGEDKPVPGGHTLVFRDHALERDPTTQQWNQETLIDITKWRFVFMHWSNPDRVEALKAWGSRGLMGKVVGISAGTEADFGRLPGIHDVSSQMEHLRWSAVPGDFEGDGNQLVDLLLGSAPLLHALAILSQGYLVAHADDPEIVDVLSKIGWHPDCGIRLSPEQAELTEDPGWWLASLGLCPENDRDSEFSWHRFEKQLKGECRKPAAWELLRETLPVSALRGHNKPVANTDTHSHAQKPDPRARIYPPLEVAKSYIQIAEIIGQ